MILKGSTIRSVGHARKMAAHLFKEENEVILVQETIAGGNDRATFENDLVEMQLYTRMTKGNRGIFSVAISPREHESLTPEQEARAIQMIEEKFGLSGQTRLKMDHVKEGRAHSHLFWSVVDQEKGILIDLPHYKRKLQDLGRDMEQEFNHEPTPRTPGAKTIEITDADRMIEGRTGHKAQDRKKEITAIWEQTETGHDFLEQIRHAGYDVAMGNKSRFVLIDQDGHTFNLSRDLPRLVKVKDVRERFGDLYQDLLSVKEAQKQMEARQIYDREQAEINRQNRELDAADEAGKQKAISDREIEQKDKKESRKSRDIIRGPERPSPPVNDNKFVYDDSHLVELDRAQERERKEDARRYALKEENASAYNREAIARRLEALQAQERLSKAEKEEAAALEKRISNIDMRIAERRGALEKMIQEERVQYEKPYGTEPPVVNLEAERRKRAIEAWKERDRNDPGPIRHDRDRDRGQDIER